jgi:hypothetical protein
VGAHSRFKILIRRPGPKPRDAGIRQTPKKRVNRFRN